jgi:hypothetical protein
MSQTEAILKHLKAGKKLTPLQALNKFGTLRLGARILDLRRAGYDVKTTMVRKGRSRVAEYAL